MKNINIIRQVIKSILNVPRKKIRVFAVANRDNSSNYTLYLEVTEYNKILRADFSNLNKLQEVKDGYKYEFNDINLDELEIISKILDFIDIKLIEMTFDEFNVLHETNRVKLEGIKLYRQELISLNDNLDLNSRCENEREIRELADYLNSILNF